MKQFCLAAGLTLAVAPALAATVEYTATVKLTGILYVDDVRTNYVLDMPSPLVFTFEGEDSYEASSGLTTIPLPGIGTIELGENGSGSYLSDTITLDPGINADVGLSVPDMSSLYQRHYTMSATGSFSRDFLMELWPEDQARQAIDLVFQPLPDGEQDHSEPDLFDVDSSDLDIVVAPIPPSMLMLGTALVALYWRFKPSGASA